ncbi:MAG: (Fe-S)-binding protein, partial [Bacteroidales bacterium]|nr:(Fe-S)-binding protein [Bacteroidales bacterium]
ISLITPATILKNIKDIIFDCLLHVKIWKRKPLLGYMHSIIAFGWFMLIVLGHIEVALFVPKHFGSISEGALFYPIFYRFFVWVNPAHETLRSNLLFFLMDFFLLYVLSGIALAMFKRIKSIALGMKHTTKPSLPDRIALYCLWLIFPLRLLAESFTADLSGGSFLTVPMNFLFKNFFGNSLNFMPTWWAYSIVLGLFFVAMPFSRYMHIVTEVLLILFRNAGLKVRKPRKGLAEAEIYACSSCGLCLDACPMNIQKKNLKYSSVYFIRFLRRHNTKKINEIAQKCLMCGKCYALCPVSVDSPAIRQAQRATFNNCLPYDYGYLAKAADTGLANNYGDDGGKQPEVMYFAGCMSHLVPVIIESMKKIFKEAGIDYVFADEDGGICCGRPLLLAGRTEAAGEVMESNKKMIEDSGCKFLVLSCPICYKVFNEEYNLKGIKIIHHTQLIDRLIDTGRLEVTKSDGSFVYHDPCDLGRGSGIYEEPRHILSGIGELKKASKERDESICCGGSLGSLTLDYKDRGEITQGSIESLLAEKPREIATACPLCFKTFGDKAPVPVKDIAQIVCEHLAQKQEDKIYSEPGIPIAPEKESFAR